MKKLRVDFKKLRKETARRQSEIAKKTGHSQAAISLKINQHRPLSIGDLNAIAEVLRIDVTEFLVIEESLSGM